MLLERLKTAVPAASLLRLWLRFLFRHCLAMPFTVLQQAQLRRYTEVQGPSGDGHVGRRVPYNDVLLRVRTGYYAADGPPLEGESRDRTVGGPGWQEPSLTALRDRDVQGARDILWITQAILRASKTYLCRVPASEL